ncbi:class I SAM-dependent methyltransferase [Lutibacter sp. HS1-25]|uniref:class I SAM-dependent methyltransferase n=1 Tax=Lutibacter sp. HS1-25 TaxID=2485000 RepID=UPI0010101442|nr:class I SAM-dependent methyltransferase [Lutibacter sp. HS1-25]RXP54109.1 class I SAM-dependent methyltransferase [Lutibacter sp. HS1-25]
MKCSLCNSSVSLTFQSKKREYYKCNNCFAIGMSPLFYPSTEKEINRYQNHNNDVNDVRYQNFVNPIVKNVLSDFKPNHIGLDFGCGTGPVITKLLRDQNFRINTYDPFFDNNIEALNTTFDYIVCCEVIEHFHYPYKEFKLLKSLLKPNGKMYFMTDPYIETIDFENWYYKDDDTHVFFYHKNTFEWLKEEFNFSKVTIENRLIIFEN